MLPATPAYATPINALYGGRFLTPEDVLTGLDGRVAEAAVLAGSGGRP